MRQFSANLKNELFKLQKRKKYLVFLIIGCLLCVGSALRLAVARLVLGAEVPTGTVLGSLVSGNLFFILSFFLPLMALMAVCDLFSGELADHTIRFSLMRPVGKGKLFFSKAAAALLVCLFDLAVLLLVTGLTQLLLGGGTRGLASSLLACLLDIPPLAVLILFFCLLNQLFKGSGLTVLLCLVLYLALAAVGTYLPAAGGLLFTGYLRWHNLWLGTTIPFAATLTRVGLVAGYGLIFGSCGFLLFDRKEG